VRALLDDWAASSDEVIDEHDQGDHQDQMNERAANMKRKSEKPKYEQNYKNRPKHNTLLDSLSGFVAWGKARKS
jgi:hypothetical protein